MHENRSLQLALLKVRFFAVSLSVVPRMYLWRVMWDLLWSIVLYILGGVVDSPSSSLDDRLSLSSNEMESEDEMMEQEETSSQPDDALPSSNRLQSIHRHPTSSKKNKGASIFVTLKLLQCFLKFMWFPKNFHGGKTQCKYFRKHVYILVLISSSGSYPQTKGRRSRGRHLQNHTGYILSPLTSGAALSSSTLGANCALNNNLLNLAAGSIQQDRQMYNSTSSTGYQDISITSVNVVESGSPSTGNSAVFSGKTSEYELVP